MSARALVAVALLLVVAGCGSGIPVNSPSSPLGGGWSDFTECMPDPSAAGVSYGVIELSNDSAAPVVIDRVRLDGARHLRLIAALSVPAHDSGIGMDSWPPQHEDITQPGFEWGQRVAAVGSPVPPTHGRGSSFAAEHGLVRDLVLHLRPAGPRATASGVQVSYHQGRHRFELRSTDKIIVVGRSRRC
jgi:hypothetical protein